MEYWSDEKGTWAKGFGDWEWLRVEDGRMNKYSSSH
jgi:hypothetical protein